MKPFFSVVIPLYNKQNHITDTINCVLKQSFSDFEIIIVNDGSTDNSIEKVSCIQDPRLTIYSIKNQGVSHARNYGVDKINSTRIVFLDADDFWETEHLQTLFNLYQTFPHCGLYCTAYKKRHNHTIIPSTYNGIPAKKNWKGIVEDYFKSSVINSIAWTSAVSVPLEHFKSVNGFDESITLGAGEDTDLWIKLALKYPVAFTNKVTATHNLFSDNRISNSNTNLRNFINLDRYENEAKLNPSLKKYLDLNRFSIAIQYKLANNHPRFTALKNSIDFNNLNAKQRLLLQAPSSLLKTAKTFQFLLQKANVNLSAFK